jgi:hypothetical protein
MTDERMRIEYWPMSPRLTVASGSTRWAAKSASWSANEP